MLIILNNKKPTIFFVDASAPIAAVITGAHHDVTVLPLVTGRAVARVRLDAVRALAPVQARVRVAVVGVDVAQGSRESCGEKVVCE